MMKIALIRLLFCFLIMASMLLVADVSAWCNQKGGYCGASSQCCDGGDCDNNRCGDKRVYGR
uniref:Uncharacterized protein n=1 Tax=Strigamia maritima TaxID=126957 RepID=T1INX0_STRMM